MLTRKLCLAALLLVALVPRLGADCSGDPGNVLTVPPTPGIGEPITICCQAEPASRVFLMASLGQGPTMTPFGTFCLDFPPLVIFGFTMAGSGQVCFTTMMPCDKGLPGVSAYLQFVAFGTSTHLSNQAALTVVDNGRCP